MFPVFPAIMVMAINFLVDAVWTLVFAAWPYVIRHLQVYKHEDYTGSKKQSITYKTLKKCWCNPDKACMWLDYETRMKITGLMRKS